MTVGVAVRFHVCPVCWREDVGGLFVFHRHFDKAGNWCPMSSEPIPQEEVR